MVFSIVIGTMGVDGNPRVLMVYGLFVGIVGR